MASDEIEQVALIASLHNRTGGNMAEVLDRVAEGVRERADLRRELQALTSQARLSRWVVTLIPPAVAGAVMVLDPTYMKPLFTTTTGIIMLAVATTLVIIGSLVMAKMTEIKV
jgi:tight adherence protein B